MDKISIVIPSYNHAQYIEQSISSALNQNCDSFTIELIVVDDCSSDGSREFLKSLLKNYNFKLHLNDVNIGVAATLNYAIRNLASGDFIAILASDDYWHEDKLKYQYSELLNNADSELCYSGAFVVMDNGVVRPRNRVQWKGNALFPLFFYNFVPACTVMFSKSLFLRAGGYTGGMALEDWDFLLRAASLTRFSVVNESLAYYRVHKGSSMKRLRSSNVLLQQKKNVLIANARLMPRSVLYLAYWLHWMYESLKQAQAIFFK
jgi:alpha-1,3-rhamnosyltransferase